MRPMISDSHKTCEHLQVIQNEYQVWVGLYYSNKWLQQGQHTYVQYIATWVTVNAGY